MKRPPISEATRGAILEAAWSLIVETRSADVSLAEIARAAGVSRQSIHLAFGGRTGLLVAMARHADSRSEHSAAMREIRSRDDGDPATLLAYTDAWLRHLPEIYPVGILLVAASVTDADAAAVLRDRMVDSLLAAFTTMLHRLDAAGHLAPGRSPEEAAQACWSLTHLDAWKHLVVECGWSEERFRRDRSEIISRTILAKSFPGG